MLRRIRHSTDLDLPTGSSNSPIHAEQRRVGLQAAKYQIRMKGVAAMANAHTEAVVDVTIHQIWGANAILRAAESVSAGSLAMMDLTAQHISNAVIVNQSDFRSRFG